MKCGVVSLVGRPNVGKSSLLNAILNKERAIVSNIAGTTRDATDTRFKYDGKDYIAIDTAGMRKKGRIFESVEKYSLIRSLKAIERSDVCVEKKVNAARDHDHDVVRGGCRINRTDCSVCQCVHLYLRFFCSGTND